MAIVDVPAGSSGPLISALTLAQLRVFHAVATRRSFASAAEALCLSQATVSEQVKRAETALGLRLLRRSRGRRGVDLTDAGSVLLDASEGILASLERARLELQALRSAERGVVAFGAEPVFGGYVMPRVLRDFREAHPRIEVVSRVEYSPRLAEAVQRGQLDLAVVVADEDRAGLQRQPMGGYDAICVARPGLVPGTSPVPLADVASLPWVLPKPGFVLRRRIDDLAAQGGIRLQVALELDSNEAKVRAALDGLGIAPVSSHAAAPWLASGQLKHVQAEGFPINIAWELIARPEPLSPAAQAFRGHLLGCRA